MKWQSKRDVLTTIVNCIRFLINFLMSYYKRINFFMLPSILFVFLSVWRIKKKKKNIIKEVTRLIEVVAVCRLSIHPGIVRGTLGYIRNRKTEEKNHPKPQNRKKNTGKTENRK